MMLFPVPKELQINEGVFKVTPTTKIVLSDNCGFEDLETARVLQNEIEKLLGFKLNITKSIDMQEGSGIYLVLGEGNKESYSLVIKEDRAELIGEGSTGLFYAVQTLRQIFRNDKNLLSCLEIHDEPTFPNRGFYHDATRGKVPTLETMKELVDKCALYKLNQLQLYVEHSFAFKKHSELWADAEPLTAEEILLLDEYARKRHVELVPSLATFGHLYHALTSYSYSHLCEYENVTGKEFHWFNRMAHHTLDVSNEESIEFVKDMLNEFIPLFSSNQFNICCDETFDLGKGKNKALAEEKGEVRLYVDFLNKIIKAVKEHNKKVMFWGDIILKEPQLINEIDDDVICLNWDYAGNCNENATKKFSELNRIQYVCPGVGGWNQYMNLIENSFNNISRMTKYGAQYGAIGVLNTDWGDYGHINLFANSIPGMIYGAAVSWNASTCDEDFEKVYEEISFLEYGDESKKLISLLADLAKTQVGGHMDLAWWRQVCLKKDCSYEGTPWVKTNFEQKDTTKLALACEKARKLEEEILKVGTNCRWINGQDLQEFCVSARAIDLHNAMYRVIEIHELNKKDLELIYEPKELAVKFEYWFNDYSKLWKNRNKDSELFRIKEVIQDACAWLRTV